MPAPRILIIRFSALGDVILTTPVLHGIRAAVPDADITFVTKEPYRELMEAQGPVSRVVSLLPGESARSLLSRVGTGYDLGIDLQGSIRSHAVRRAVRIPWSVVTKPRMDRFRAIWLGRQSANPHVVARYLDTARRLVELPADQDPTLQWKPDHEPPDGNNEQRVVLAPGAAHRSKQWPAESWHELASRLGDHGWDPVIVGLPADQPKFRGIAAEDGWNLSLLQTIALIGRSRVAVTHDSGLMHAATAVGTPVVSLFGPTVPWLGFSPRGPHQVLERALPCRPCSAFGQTDCPAGHHRCLRDISPGAVSAAVAQAA